LCAVPAASVARLCAAGLVGLWLLPPARVGGVVRGCSSPVATGVDAGWDGGRFWWWVLARHGAGPERSPARPRYLVCWFSCELDALPAVGQPVGLIEVRTRWRDTASVPPTAISEIARPAAAPIPASPQSKPLLGAMTRTIVGSELWSPGSGVRLGWAAAVVAVSVSSAAASASVRSVVRIHRPRWVELVGFGTVLACLSGGLGERG
jgi:hypothetical protein